MEHGLVPTVAVAIHSDTLEPLLEVAEGFVPGMTGRVGHPEGSDGGYITAGTDNRAALRGLTDAIRAAHPEAGPGYWALRSWNMLEWQPVVLTLLGVHALERLPLLEGMGLRVQGGGVLGYRLPRRAPLTGPVGELIDRGGQQLRQLAEGLLADLGAVIRIKPLLARRLLADRVLGVLLELAARRPELSTGVVEDHARRWLAALELEGQSGLTAVPSSRLLLLERRACCLAYRTVGGLYCDSCPKLPPEERLRRVRVTETPCSN